MTTLNEIEVAIGRTIVGNMPDDSIYEYAEVPAVAQFPAIVVMPAPRDSADFKGSFGHGMTTWTLDVIVLVRSGAYDATQEVLADLIDPANPTSVPRALQSDETLGLGNDVDCNVDGIRLYGVKPENANIPSLGAVIKVTVRCPGR